MVHLLSTGVWFFLVFGFVPVASAGLFIPFLAVFASPCHLALGIHVAIADLAPFVLSCGALSAAFLELLGLPFPCIGGYSSCLLAPALFCPPAGVFSSVRCTVLVL